MNKQSARRSVPIWLVSATKSAKFVSLLKLFKLTKVLLAASSLLLSTLAYGWAFGPMFAIGLISMLFIHEMGHVIALWHKGIRASLPVFIPFLGAMIFTPPIEDRETEAYVGYGGPFLGSAAALVCMAMWAYTGSQILLLTAFLGVYLNLLNMIPISPLDGGRIGQIIGPHVVYFGMAALVAFTVYAGEPGLLIIWLFTLIEMRWNLWWRPIVAGILLIIMTVLFSLDYGTQPEFINDMDVFLGSLYLVLYCSIDVGWYRAMMNVGLDLPGPVPTRNNPSLRPYPSARTRYSWLVVYVASVAVLWTAMSYLVAQIPPH